MTKLVAITVILILGLTAIGLSGCVESCPLWQQVNGGC